jgi:hypothetical protein
VKKLQKKLEEVFAQFEVLQSPVVLIPGQQGDLIPAGQRKTPGLREKISPILPSYYSYV